MTEDEARGTTGGWRWPLGPIRIMIIATAVLSVVFLLIPQLDLWFSRQFHDAAIGFPASRIPALQWLRDLSGILLRVIVGIIVISLLAKILVFPRRRPIVPGRAMLFLSSTLALSAGLLVNGILKSLWGRPRPTEVLEFGGDAPFVTAWHISDYCARNCSFVSGESSAAIWLVAVALVVPARFRRAALATALALAFAFSLNRIAFGGHFLSDVLLAWTLTLLIIAVAYHFLYVRPPRFLDEAAIDGALTRAGLWLRGLVARRKKEDSPLHPEAVAVLAGSGIRAHAHGNEVASPTGYRAAGLGFAGAAVPDEPTAADHEPPPVAWPEDGHGAADVPDDDALPQAAPARPAVFPETTAAIPARAPATPAAVLEADDAPGSDLDVAAVALPAGYGNIESIDPEPEELPPPVPTSAALAELAGEVAPARPAEIHSGHFPRPAPSDPDDHDMDAAPAAPDPAAAEEQPADTEAGGDDVPSPGRPAAEADQVDGNAAAAVPDVPEGEDGRFPADTDAGDEAGKPVPPELPPPDRS